MVRFVKGKMLVENEKSLAPSSEYTRKNTEKMLSWPGFDASLKDGIHVIRALNIKIELPQHLLVSHANVAQRLRAVRILSLNPYRW